MILKLPASIVCSLVLLISLAASATAQQKRQTPAKPQTPPAPAPAPTPPPTLETLLPADTYRIYGEIRSVGQLIKSNSVNEILEPILKLAGPPKEFRTALKWLNTHADEVMSSRMIVAAWTTQKDIPDTLVAIEFASPEEASRFQLQLNPFLQKMMQQETPTPTGEPNKTEPPQPPPPPPYHIQQAGSLILITSTPLNLKKLRPAGSKLLAEDVDFRVARNRLNTESIFVFVDVNAIEKEEEEQRKRAEESREKLIAERAAKAQPTEMPKVEVVPDPEEPEPTFVPEKHDPANAEVELGKDGTGQGIGPVGTPPPFYLALGMVMGSLSAVEAKWPAAIGVGLSLEGDSFDLRAFLVNAPGEKSDPIPFLPVLAPGPAIAPEAPNILPADTEMLITASLDLPYIYTAVSKPRAVLQMSHGQMTAEQPSEMQSPLVDLEKQLKINIKDQLLPLLGSEIAISLPMTGMDWLQPPRAATPTSQPSPLPSPEPSPDPENTSADTFTITETTRNVSFSEAAPILVLSLKDKEGMRALLPKLIESMAFKGASSLAQTERREDTELVSYVNVVAYAFIGNFLVISPDVKATRHVVDSYLKHQTLSGDIHFKNYTRWLPRQVQGQVYISPSLMESYRTWIQQPTAPVDEQTRAFLTRFSIVAQPVTYSLSNEGFGPLHELHLPKNLVLLLIAATVGNKDAPQYQASPPDPKPVVAQPPKLPANPSDRPF